MSNISVLSFNIHKGKGWRGQKYNLHKLRDQIRSLQSDVVFIQESRDSQFEFLACGVWPYITYGKNVSQSDSHHGNAILSKHPISFSENINLSMGKYERRGLLHAIIHPVSLDSQPVHLICVHLGLFNNDRIRQLSKIVDHVISNIPKNELLILGGDFNDWLSQATEPLMVELQLQEAFQNQHGKYAKTFPSWAPMLKLDRIYTRGFDTHHAERLIQPSWRPLSDHVALNAHLVITDDSTK